MYSMRNLISKITGKPQVTYLHIGKTGGSTLHNQLRISYRNNPRLLLKHKALVSMCSHSTTICDIPSKHLIAFGIRDPTTLMQSAFYNYHPKYKNKYETPFKAEQEAFYSEFPTYKSWVSAMMKNKNDAQEIFRLNMHMERRLEYYLHSPETISQHRERIYHIFNTATMNEDMQQFSKKTRIKYQPRRMNASGRPTNEKLTQEQLEFLAQCFRNDYECYDYCIQIKGQLEC